MVRLLRCRLRLPRCCGEGMAPVIFLLATVTKALEPLAVSHSSGGGMGAPAFPYPVGWAIVVIEMIKLGVCAAALQVQLLWLPRHGFQRTALVQLDGLQFLRLGIPALLLAIANWGMFAALARLDPLLYQIFIKTIIIFATAVVSQVVLRRWLVPRQWLSLLLLLVGCTLAVPDISDLPQALQSATINGLLIASGASVAMALNGVYFELVSKEGKGLGQSVLWQNVQASVWGVLVNVVLLMTFGAEIGGGDGGPSPERGPSPELIASHIGGDREVVKALRGGCLDLGAAGWVAVTAVAAADITMNVAFKVLGANAYNFARAGSILLSVLFQVNFFGASISNNFLGGALAVLLAAELYQRSLSVPVKTATIATHVMTGEP